MAQDTVKASGARTERSDTRNRFTRLEWAGAFGDLGTLIPFVVAYITLLKMDPFGVLLAFGIMLVACGLYYKTPFPVQPMKAIGTVATAQAAQNIVITANAVYCAGIVTGVVWLVLGVTGATRKVATLLGRPVALGIILGLGFAFMLEGIKMMAAGWLLGGIALLGTLLLLANPLIPAMFVLLIFGVLAAVIRDPSLIEQLAALRPEMRLPGFALASVTWHDLVVGTLFLALPQVPLTLGNAIIAVTEENNRLFPDRKVSEKGVSISTGLMNVFGPLVGGVPMCHGAGGMAGHVRFGARTGGAPIVLGAILIVVAFFFSGSVETIFKIFPDPVLGVILFLTGSQLALGAMAAPGTGHGDGDRFVVLATAAFAVWNIGVAFIFGAGCHYLLKRKWLRL